MNVDLTKREYIALQIYTAYISRGITITTSTAVNLADSLILDLKGLRNAERQGEKES